MDCKKVCKCCDKKNHHEPLHCQCHHKKKKCDCKKDMTHKDKKFLKDCMKIDWTVPRGQTQTIFQAGGLEQIIGSGFVSYDLGDSPFVIVRFFFAGAQQGLDIRVFEDSSVAFSYTKFDQVTVECPSSGGTGTHNCEGQLSIISRFTDS